MGHALNNTLQDVIIRFKRMQGYNACWVPGTDHGGIATQNVVEKILLKEGITRQELGREKFLERMWQWRKETGDTILHQLKKLGCSCDWERLRFTMDDNCSRAVLNAFVELYKQGLIYWGSRLVNWCVRCGTALADIEVEYREHKGHLWYIRYPLKSAISHQP
ncbi:MAG TPA: valine--tRNA ligase, partial [Elusimicrobia bacterium]|nr:valine--tRNA ligase [Elusimicrobiota bacterium]